MSKTKYLIYRIIFPNGKSYVGWTNKMLGDRKRDHLCTTYHKKRRYAVHEAIRKYGSENLKWEVIYESYDKEFSLNIMETYCIKLYQSHISQNGYNLTWGGDAPGLGVVQSEETRRKRSLSLKGKPSGRKGTPLTFETKKKLSIMRIEAKNPFYGKIHSEDFKKQQSQTVRENPRRKDPITGKFIKSPQ